MNHLYSLMPLADARIEAVHEAFNTRKTDLTSLTVAIIVFAVGLGILFGGIYLRRRNLSRRINNPAKLFSQLCRAHHLSRQQRFMLQQLSDVLALPTPSVLMLDAHIWQLDHLLQAQKINAKQRDDLKVLQRTLYSQPRII